MDSAADVEVIARGLTKAQREALLRETITFVEYCRLAAHKLVNMWSLTPLGLAVKRHLEAGW